MNLSSSATISRGVREAEDFATASSAFSPGIRKTMPELPCSYLFERDPIVGVDVDADREHAFFGRDEVARAGDQERRRLVRDDQERFELAQHLVGPPVLGELDRGA